MSHVVGIDIGHSAVKISTETEKFQFPAVYMTAMNIQEMLEAARCEQESVSIEGQKYFYGETAEAQAVGDSLLGLNDNWVDTTHHEVLVAAAIKELKKRGVVLDSNSILVTGLPIKVFQETKTLIAAQFKKQTQADVRVVPQPFGPFFYTMLDQHGASVPNRVLTNGSYAVVDVGYYTTDIILMKNGRFIQMAAGSAEGGHIAVKHLKQLIAEKMRFNPTLTSCEKAMRGEKFTVRGNEVDVLPMVQLAKTHLAEHVIDRVKNSLGSVIDEVNAIIVAGGGANLIDGHLKNTWEHAETVADPRMSIAEGMRRMGLSIQLSRKQAA